MDDGRLPTMEHAIKFSGSQLAHCFHSFTLRLWQQNLLPSVYWVIPLLTTLQTMAETLPSYK